MYFMDFLKDPNINPSCRYFLSGDNDFLKTLSIDKLSTQTGRSIIRVESVKDINIDAGLFDKPKLYVLGTKSNPKKFRDFTVKLSKSKMGKTYKQAGFTEVVCSNLFPNQAKQLGAEFASRYGLSASAGRSLAEMLKYDPYSIYNASKVLGWVAEDIDLADFPNYIEYLGLPDTYKIVDYFIEGDYLEFINHVKKSHTNIHEILWSLLGAVTRLQGFLLNAHKSSSWYQKKMVSAASKLAPAGIDGLIVEISRLAASYGESREVLLLKLQRLIFHIKNSS